MLGGRGAGGHWLAAPPPSAGSLLCYQGIPTAPGEVLLFRIISSIITRALPYTVDHPKGYILGVAALWILD